MVMDFLSGIVKAISKKQLASKKMREGLLHKVALGLCMLLGAAVDYAQGYMELGVHFPVGRVICVYIVLMEITSIMENICVVNPQITPEMLRKIFAGDTGNVDGGEKHE